MKLALRKLITLPVNILQVLHQSNFKVSFIQLISKAWQNGKIEWIFTKYKTWFDFFLALFMSENQRSSKFSFPTTSKLTDVKSGWLALKDDLQRSHLSHLYLLVNKAKDKSNQVSYRIVILSICPFFYFY